MGKLIPVGHLPDFEGNPILASCINCAHCTDDSDGPEYGGPFYSCSKKGREFIGNLKGFPFNTSQACCELSIAFSIDWRKETPRMVGEFLNE